MTVRTSEDHTTQLSRTGETPGEAREKLQAALTDLLAEVAAERKARELEALAQEHSPAPPLRHYLQWVQERIEARTDPDVRSEASRTRYLSVLATWGGLPRHDGKPRTHRHTSAVLDIPVDQLRAATLEDEMARIQADGGLAALIQLRALWRKALARAVREGVIEQSPAASLRVTGVTKARGQRVYNNGHVRRRDNALTDAQVSAILEHAAADPRAVRRGTDTLLQIVAGTGLRINEATSLRWQDLDLDSDPAMLTIRGQLVRRPGEGLRFAERLKSRMSFREVPVKTDLAEHLRERLATRPASPRRVASPYILATDRRTTPDPDNTRSDVRRVLDNAGFPWATTHTLRRTVENRLVAARVPPQVIERLMGHTATTGHKAYWDRKIDVRGAITAL